MRYYLIEQYELLPYPHGELFTGELVTEREAARETKVRREAIERAPLIEWPAKDTEFINGVRFRSLSMASGSAQTSKEFPMSDLGENIDCLRQGVPERLTPDEAREIANYLDKLDNELFEIKNNIEGESDDH